MFRANPYKSSFDMCACKRADILVVTYYTEPLIGTGTFYTNFFN
jgi:hypothetical protein